jgi:very-short-patch-repair endonuclease
MDTQTLHREAWALAARQHGVLSRRQLTDLGLDPQAIKHRLKKGRLHSVHRGIYAVGRPELTDHGRWMAAVLLCEPDAFLSHGTAAALWGLESVREDSSGAGVDITVRAHRRLRARGVRIHRTRHLTDADLRRCRGIPVTSPSRTIVDLAAALRLDRVEAAINEADNLGLVSAAALRRRVRDLSAPGAAVVRAVLDAADFRVTDSELERRFLRIVRRANLPLPLTRQRVNGFRVDFFWPELRMVVETDGLRYHRTPTQQSRDRVRDQAHVAAGLIALRFTHRQVVFEGDRVLELLRSVAEQQRLVQLTAKRVSPVEPLGADRHPNAPHGTD